MDKSFLSQDYEWDKHKHSENNYTEREMILGWTMSKELLYMKAKAKHEQQEKSRREWECLCFALKLCFQKFKHL